MSRFKHDFEPYIELMFQRMVDYTEPICQLIDSSLSQMLTFDTSGIELYVTENNPKTLNALIKKLKVFYKDKPDIDPYKNSILIFIRILFWVILLSILPNYMESYSMTFIFPRL